MKVERGTTFNFQPSTFNSPTAWPAALTDSALHLSPNGIDLAGRPVRRVGVFVMKCLPLFTLAASAILAGLSAAATASAAPATFDIVDFGAVGDGTTLTSAAVQRAIDACSAAGGGTVEVPAGRFLIGTILLKDGVTLHLDDKATLLGTTDLDAYRNVDPFKDGQGAEVGFAMVAAVDAHHVGLTGRGVILGRGKEIAAAAPKGASWGRRPFLVRIVRCTDVSISDLQLQFAGSWTTNFFQCQNVSVTGVKLQSYGAPHNDGLDIDSCEHVRIKDCDIESGDDSICLKATSSRPCRDITATGCRLKSNQGAIKFGTESVGDFEDIAIDHCQIRDTRNGGIKLLSVDGAHLRNVTISDITMENVATPIFVRLGARRKTFRPGDAPRETGTIEHVVIKNIQARSAGKATIVPPSGVFITGIPDHAVTDLTLENIVIELPGGGEKTQGRQALEEKVDAYPEINRFAPCLPAYGLYARHVRGLKISGFVLKLAAPDARPAVVCDDGQDIVLSGCEVPGNTDAESLVRLENVRNGRFDAATVTGEASTWVRVEGEGSAQLKIASPGASVKKTFELAAGAKPAAVVDLRTP